ncbi:MAG: 50S ribosomal protein L19 [bacterium]|nr:50S ribosomal protein L19 [bacterium]
MRIIDEVEREYLKKKTPAFRVGDTLKVHVRVVEGDKERVQVFTGRVIARKGSGTSASVTLRKVSYGEGVERMFFLHSPRVARIEVAKSEPARRAKLYYTRGRVGAKER